MQAMISETSGQERIGHLGIQLFFTRRETCRLGPVTALLSGDESVRGRWAPGLLGVYTALGMREPAARLLALMADDGALRANWRSEYMPTALAFLVEAALLLADAAMLTKLRPMVAEHSGLNLVSDQFIAHHGSADRYLGMIDSNLGHADPLELFDAAADLDRRSGSVVHLGLTLVARARHLAKVSGPASPAVSAALAQAREVATPIGHTRVLRAAAALAPEPSKVHLRFAEPSGLTPRELEVLGLLAQGASNQEIARSLVISQNTAANHVRSILLKTATSNRTQAAMLAVSRGWVAPKAAASQGSTT
jgi:DNA-binding CsgD family transcriptional regulator